MNIRKKEILTFGFLNLILVFSMAQNPFSSFNTNQTSGCSPLSIQFTNTSLNAASYYWDFGNGNISTLVNPSNVYSNAGTYTVKLVAFGANGQKDSLVSSNLITVSSNSIPDFHAVNTVSCLDGNIFSFVNTSINSTNCLWDFGDGTTSTLQNPNHTYLAQGNYNIKLITYDTYGCPSIKIRANYIQVSPNPDAEFTVNTTVGCSASQVFNFLSTSSAVNTWSWDFGDGNTSSLNNPNHTYNASGTYTVALTVTNTIGCINKVVLNDYILVAAPQTPVFTVNSATGCLPLGFTFTNQSTSSVSWLWNFGDSETSIDEHPSHTYQNSGNYTVSLTITTDNNCTYTKTINNFISIANNPVSNFSISNTNNCSPINVQLTDHSTNAIAWQWDFGDGYTSTLQNPSHTYATNGSYSITLHSFGTLGCVSTYKYTNAVILAAPVASFNANYTPGCTPLTTNFVNTSANAVQWLWNFGDGTFSNLKDPAHTYNLPGDYTVSLVAFDTQGCSDTLTLNSYIHVINAAGSYIPPATITGCVPFNTTFSNIAPGAVSWFWNFGDGGTSTQQNPSHTYITSGFYTVSLSVQLSGGCSQFYSNLRTFNIKGGQPEFTFLTQTQCAAAVVNFTGIMPGNLLSNLWDFGDGQTSALQNPIHTYSNAGFYTVKYTATTAEGCTGTVTESNCIHFVPCAPIGNDNENDNNNNNSNTGTNSSNPSPSLNGCIPLIVHFNNILPGTISWLWNFGDGNTSTLQNPFHTYTLNGNYDVTLIAQNNMGESDTIIYLNYIHASGINTDFNFTKNSDCQNTTFTLTGISPNASAWHWDFNDGNSSQQQNPIHTYSNTINNYTISLTTSNSQGCSGSISKNLLFTEDNSAIWADNYQICTEQPVNFNCSSANFITYLWNFGDGTTSVIQNPSHFYLNSGTYQVTLTLTDNQGCTYNSSLQNFITVKKPTANFTFSLANGCNSQTINFSNLSTATSLPLSAHCKWNFGDGSADQFAENPTHVYSGTGTYQVTLSVNNDNCFNSITKTVSLLPIVADFSYTQNTTCFPITATYNDSSSNNAVSWLWDFGDGTTSTLQNPVHVFTQAPVADVTLTIKDVNACLSTIAKSNITVFYTDFYASVTEGCAPMNIDFLDASLNANQWLWYFGDGTTSTLQNPTHAYLYNGINAVMLISKSIDGCSDTMVFNSINVNRPVANFISANPINCSPALVTFTDLSIDAASWLWDFGDGSSSVNQHPGHIYNIPGLYTIKLIVTNSIGCSDTLTRIDYIKVPGPIANFSASSNQSCIGSAIQFTDLSTDAVSWNWNFGDGNTSVLQNPSTTYQNTGQYVVSLIVFDLQGCTANYTFANPVTIKPLPVADFTISDTVACTPFPVSIQNHSQNAVSYLWNFGDGVTSSLMSPSHTYLNYGVYTLSMIATNQFGCSDIKIVDSIVANGTPAIDFHANISEGCSPLMVSFSDSSANVQNATYFWDLGNGSTSLTQNSKTTYTNPGLYSVSLIITNNTGCSDTITKTGYVEVYDFNPPDKSNILAVTVISDTSTLLIWNQSTATDFSYYEIYRKDNLTGNYFSVATVNNRSITSFTDVADLNTLTNSYCYKVQTIDNCGYTVSLDSLQEHCTIDVTATGISDDIQVNWTPYIGASVYTYTVYRVEGGSEIAVLVATVPSTILSFLDTTLACPLNFSYRIKADNLNGNLFSSSSDTSIAKPLPDVFVFQKVEVVRSTIIDNNKVLTEWNSPLIAPEKVAGYSIYRSTDNLNFSFLTKVLPSIHEYIDMNVDVNNQNYYYTVRVVNSCNVEAEVSNKSSSILLKAELVNGNINLNWTSYDGWNSGVDYYIIEKMNEQGEWEKLKKVDGNTLIYEDQN